MEEVLQVYNSVAAHSGTYIDSGSRATLKRLANTRVPERGVTGTLKGASRYHMGVPKEGSDSQVCRCSSRQVLIITEST